MVNTELVLNSSTTFGTASGVLNTGAQASDGCSVLQKRDSFGLGVNTSFYVKRYLQGESRSTDFLINYLHK